MPTGLQNIEGMTSLEELCFLDTHVSPADVRRLGSFPRLTRLWVWVDLSTDADMEDLTRLTQLEELHLRDIPATCQRVKKLQEALPKCKIYEWQPK